MNESYMSDTLIRGPKPIKGTGHRFLIARLAKNFSRMTVARMTKIPMERLIEIESCAVEPTEDEISTLQLTLQIRQKRVHRNYPTIHKGASKC